mgnify:CR=1 FL=1
MKIHKLAAIDIGSNSIRLLVSNVFTDATQEQVVFKKSSLTRLPVRLGPDAFKKGEISGKNIEKLIVSMSAYARIMEVHEVERYRACATSALREASNGIEVTREIYRQTGINVELIDGKEEARIIFNSDFTGVIPDDASSFMYIDVGGGSTELTLFHQSKIVASRSFRIGTIRLLKRMVDKSHWEKMHQWISEVTEGIDDVLMVGSGGNINRTFKLSGNKMGVPLKKKYLKQTYNELNKCSTEERMLKYDLNPDRADVITHALRIYTRAMDWSGAKKMLVPKKGLADGIVRNLYREYYHRPGK